MSTIDRPPRRRHGAPNKPIEMDCGTVRVLADVTTTRRTTLFVLARQRRADDFHSFYKPRDTTPAVVRYTSARVPFFVYLNVFFFALKKTRWVELALTPTARVIMYARLKRSNVIIVRTTRIHICEKKNFKKNQTSYCPRYVGCRSRLVLATTILVTVPTRVRRTTGRKFRLPLPSEDFAPRRISVSMCSA